MLDPDGSTPKIACIMLLRKLGFTHVFVFNDQLESLNYVDFGGSFCNSSNLSPVGPIKLLPAIFVVSLLKEVHLGGGEGHPESLSSPSAW